MINCALVLFTLMPIFCRIGFESIENQNLQNVILYLRLNQLGHRCSYEIKADFVSNYI